MRSGKNAQLIRMWLQIDWACQNSKYGFHATMYTWALWGGKVESSP